LTEPSADLAIALAVASSSTDTPLPNNLVAIGEVGLAGEVRRVTGVQRRLAEAHRLGFTHALVPPDPGKVPPGMKVVEVSDIGEALRAIPGRRARSKPRQDAAPQGVPAGRAPARERAAAPVPAYPDEMMAGWEPLDSDELA
ncbi:magnesium chelatase domain-containing protein, partial [Kitasatospora griseola]